MTDDGLILDFYRGPGGWSEGLRLLGLSDVGIEWDGDAAATAYAAGHVGVRADCTTWPVAHLRGRVRLVIGSPPCQAFSMAGNGEGRERLEELVTAARAGDWYALRDSEPMVVWAVLDMGRIIEECWPEAVVLEQVPPVLLVWEALAFWLRAHGYSTWCSVENAADYGVPQTRKRAILTASRVRPMTGMVPTHARDPQPTLFGPELQGWVSMAEALGWTGVNFPAPTVSGGGGATGGVEPFANRAQRERIAALRVDTRGDSQRPNDSFDPVELPSRALTGKSYSWRRNEYEPDEGEGFEPEAESAQTISSRSDRWQLHPGRTDETRNRRPVPADEPAPTMHFGHDAASWRWTPDDETDGNWTGPAVGDACPGCACSWDLHDEGGFCAGPCGGNRCVGPLVVATGFNSMSSSRDVDDMVPYERSVDEPAPTLHGNAGGAWSVGAPGHRQPPMAWKERRNDQSGSGESDPDWPLDRPATTLAGRDLVPDPGANANRFNGADKSRNDGYRITIAEALVLQSIRPDYPVAGNRTSQFQQVGNMVPALLAAHAVAAALGLEPTAACPQAHPQVVDTPPL